jgi:hypothetical protein
MADEETAATIYVDHEKGYRPISPARLWFGPVAATSAWALHLMLAYALVALNCLWRIFPFGLAGLDGVRAVLLLFTLLAAAVIAAGMWVSFDNWRGLKRQAPEADPTGRYGFVSLSGVMLGGLMLVGMLWYIGPILVTNECV